MRMNHPAGCRVMPPKPVVASPPRSLASVQLFQELEAAARAGIERACQWRRWNAGEHIIDREMQDNDVYFIVAGRARAVEYNRAGTREIVLDEIVAGGRFREGCPRLARRRPPARLPARAAP